MQSFLTRRNPNAPPDRAADPRTALAPPASEMVNEAVLDANVPKRYAIPPGATYVILSASADFRAKFGSGTVVAAIPNADVTDGTASELNPAAREITRGLTHVSLIAPTGARVTLSFYGG